MNGGLCDFDVEITEQTQNVDYRVRASHPYDGSQNAYIFINPNDLRVSVITRYSYERNAGNGWELIEFQDVINQGSRRTFSSSNVLMDGGFYISMRLYESSGNSIITVPLAPTTAILSGCAGSITPADLVEVTSFNFAEALRIAVENYLCTLGFSNGTDYSFFVTGTKNLTFECKHDPTNTWIGINKDDALLVFSIDGNDIQEQPGRSTGTSPANTTFSRNPCTSTSISTRIMGHIQSGTNYNHYDVPNTFPILITNGPVPASCIENTLTANLIGNCQSEVNYLWTTTDGEILSDPTEQTISIGTDGVYNVEITCEGCPPVTQSFCIPEITPTDLVEEICEGDTLFVGNTPYTLTGTYSDTLPALNGCDSIVNLDLTVLPAAVTNLVEEICEGDSFNGYDVTGMYSDTIPGANGCDSIINLDLTVLPADVIDLIEEICEGESFVVGTSVYTMTGMYTDIFTNQFGCDSIINLDLTVISNAPNNIMETICEGESYDFNGVTLTSPGTYFDTIATAAGCDSVVILDLTVNTNGFRAVYPIICIGETYTYAGNVYDASGTFVLDLPNPNGCDSTITIYLTVLEDDINFTNATICDGDSYEWEGGFFTNPGNYTEIYTGSNGCDSIEELNLTVLPATDLLCLDGGLCDFDVEITEQTQNVDYRVRASHPYDGSQNAYIFINPNDIRISVVTRYYLSLIHI